MPPLAETKIESQPSFPKPPSDPSEIDPRVTGRPVDPLAPLANLMDDARRQGLVDAQGNLVVRPAREIDAAQVERAGIHELRGQHVRLYTDLPLDDEIKQLPVAFDAAYPQWCAYFGVPEVSNPPWRVNAFIMKDRERFQAAGLITATTPEFENGYAEGLEVYVAEQPTPYYRRHLLLHEGTHAFMHSRVPGAYPAWYFEGLAELFGTHLWEPQATPAKITTRYMPRDRDEVPYWGRTKLVHEAFMAAQAKSLPAIMNMAPDRNLAKEEYAWAWAACHFFDTHPRYRDRFRTLFRLPQDSDFPSALEKHFGSDPDLATEWQVFVANLDYGYDLDRAALQLGPGEDLPAEGKLVKVAADRGWQSTGVRLKAGKTYDITAAGRYTVAAGPPAWQSEPQGVTIRYHAGLPLGMLLAAVRPDDETGLSPLLYPNAVGSKAELTPAQTGTLYLRINEAASGLDDNAGLLQVRIK